MTLVTGAGGLIGAHIVRQLMERGRPVRALLAPNESTDNLQDMHLDLAFGDIRNRDDVERAVSGCENIIHCAALNKLWHPFPQEFYETNVEGTRHICEAAKRYGIRRLIYTSSCEVMGPAIPDVPLRDETWQIDLSRVYGDYAKSKFQAEALSREYLDKGISVTILRPTAVFGPGDIHGTPLGRLVVAVLNKKLPAYYNSGINVVDARDVAKAHVDTLDLSESIGETYIVDGYNLYLEGLFRIFEKEGGGNRPHLKIPYPVAFAAALIEEGVSRLTKQSNVLTTLASLRLARHPSFFDGTKIQREVGFQPRPLEDSIRDAIAWYTKVQWKSSAN